MSNKFINGVTNYETWRDHSKDNKKHIERMELINALREKEEISILDEIRLVNAIVVSRLTSKLDEFFGISTSVCMNPICQARARIPGSICAKCYASNLYYGSQICALESNYYILNEFLISEDSWKTLAIPTINGYARIESHGDVATLNCARNYVRIINSHKYINFGVWTKNVDLWIRAFELEGGKPENMTFIVSSPMENEICKVSENATQYVNHVFTVYSPEFVAANNVEINCGGRSCKTCLRCYRKDTEFNVSELEK